LKKQLEDVKPAAKTKFELVDQVKQFARYCRSVIELADYVDSVDKLERAANDAQAAYAAKEARETEINGRIADAQKALDALESRNAVTQKLVQEAVAAVKGEPARIIAEAKAKAVEITRAAQADAEAAKEQAARDAASAAHESRALVAKAMKEAEALIDDARQRGAEIDAATETATAALASLEQQLAAKSAELDGLEKRHQKARAQIEKLLNV
jgi:chromosome segregation ATPase